MTISSSNNETSSSHPVSNTHKAGLSVRFLAIGTLSLLMLIPLLLVSNIISERDNYYHQVLADISSLWGKEQVISGPFLLVPYVEKEITRHKESSYSGAEKTIEKIDYYNKVAVILPEFLNIDSSLKEEFRERGIYKSLVYNADSQISGEFTLPDFSNISEKLDKIEWNKAHIVMELQDATAIRKFSPVKWNETLANFEPGSIYQNAPESAFHAPVQINPETKVFQFSFDMNFNGSGNFLFTPLGKVTTGHIFSKWPHPSFQGRMLPTKHEITSEGFHATWEIPHLVRSLPHYWTLGDIQFNPQQYAVGVRLFEPVFLYSQVNRAIKYGILFIGLTFISLLAFELTLKCRFHYVQYGLVGMAMTLFYLILLSFAEHIGFFRAYIFGAVSCSLIIALYIKAALQDIKKGVLMFAILSAMYGLLYSLLQLEDYALMTGTVVLLFVIMVLMYLTRNLPQH